MGIGGFIARTAAVAAGNVASEYAVRGIDSAISNHQAARAERAEYGYDAVFVQLVEYYVRSNMLPVDAQAKAHQLLGLAQQRLAAKGMADGRPIGEHVLTANAEYCRALMEVESAQVVEIREFWDSPGLWRELVVIESEHEFHRRVAVARSEGHSDADAVFVAWKCVPVYGFPAFDASHDPDYTPLPPELYVRTQALVPGSPMGVAVTADEARARPSMNGWLRGQLRAEALPQGVRGVLQSG